MQKWKFIFLEAKSDSWVSDEREENMSLWSIEDQISFLGKEGWKLVTCQYRAVAREEYRDGDNNKTTVWYDKAIMQSELDTIIGH